MCGKHCEHDEQCLSPESECQLCSNEVGPNLHRCVSTCGLPCSKEKSAHWVSCSLALICLCAFKSVIFCLFFSVAVIGEPCSVCSKETGVCEERTNPRFSAWEVAGG